MEKATDHFAEALSALERALAAHRDAQIKNHERLRQTPHRHTAAMCQVLESLLKSFPDRKIIALVEAEIAASGKRSRPEDLVVWIELLGVLVLEIKSHTIEGIRRFENNIPVVMYGGSECEDVYLIDQPRTFAYELRQQIELEFDKAERMPPALYWAGWLPNVQPGDLAMRGQRVATDKVWLGDMLNRLSMEGRLREMKNLTRSPGADRAGLELFLNLFGCTAGLRARREPQPLTTGSLGYQIDRLNNNLKRLTHEQEELAFSPQLLRGPKVIRGVAGSGKSVVLANAVANLLIETLRHNSEDMLALMCGQSRHVRVLVVCYNRALAPYLSQLIRTCFDALKPEVWPFPEKQVEVISKDRLFKRLYTSYSVGEYVAPFGPKTGLDPQLAKFFEVVGSDLDQYTHAFVDEGQDIEKEWWPFLARLVRSDEELGPPIVVFYDDAQNVYGQRRPGTAGEPSWRELLGAEISPRGLRTVMRVGHRNTNEILSFSFNMLLGSFALRDPMMVGFAGLAAYTQESIPHDARLNHPHAGQACVEHLGARRYRVNFALRHGPWPELHACADEQAMLDRLAQAIVWQTMRDGGQVDSRDILIMTHRRECVDAIAASLRRAGLRVHVPLSPKQYDAQRGDPRDQPFFQPGHITVCTIHTAKGHTAAICHLVGLEQLEIPPDESGDERVQKTRALLHVALTRAMYQLEVWSQDCDLFREAEAVLEFLREEREPLAEQTGAMM